MQLYSGKSLGKFNKLMSLAGGCLDILRHTGSVLALRTFSSVCSRFVVEAMEVTYRSNINKHTRSGL